MSHIVHTTKPSAKQASKTVSGSTPRTLDFTGKSSGKAILQHYNENSDFERFFRPGSFQRKLTIGAPNDPFEQEADRIAERVVSSPVKSFSPSQNNLSPKTLAASISPLQRNVEEEQEIRTKSVRPCPACKKETETARIQSRPVSPGNLCPQCAGETVDIQRKAKTSTVTGDIESSITSMHQNGKPLSSIERQYFEPRFGADFSGVKIHTGSKAGTLARSVNARAFTVGGDIFFGSGEYSPGTSEGKRLMAHELTHTVQQGAARARTARISRFPLYTPAIMRQTLPPECEDLLAEILARLAELARRAAELIENKHNLPLSGPMSIEGHQQQFRNKQTNLRRKLNDWNSNNCGPPPRNAWYWATRPAPSPQSEPDGPVNYEVPEPSISAEDVAVAAGGVAVGYLIYRALRMLPSLLPPLWWTIPANAAVP